MRDMIVADAADSSDYPVENRDAHSSLSCGISVLIRTATASLVGVIENIGHHSVSVLLKHALPGGSAVSVEFGEAIMEGEIAFCSPQGNEFEACIIFPASRTCDLRAADRFPVTQPVQICASSFDYQPQDGFITDLSAHGIGVEMSLPLGTGESITLQNATDIAFGVVRYCRPLPQGRFHAGVEVFHLMPKDA